MTVTDCTIDSRNMSMSEAKDAVVAAKGNGDDSARSLIQLGALAALCNTAQIDVLDSALPVSQKRIFGDATDTAVLRFSELLEDDNIAYFQACWQRVFTLAFSSKNKFMIRCFTNTRQEALEQTLHRTASEAFKDSDQ